MSIRVTSWVWQHSRSRSSQRLVLLAIADYAKDDGTGVYPSAETLAQKAGLSDRRVRDAVNGLQRLGELGVQYRGGPRGCNRYWVIMSRADDPSGSGNLDGTPQADELSAWDTPNHVRQADDTSPKPSENQNHKELSLPRTRGSLLDDDPSPNGHSPAPRRKSPEPTDQDPDWAAFWDAYPPPRRGKAQARKAWPKATKAADTVKIIEGARRYAEERKGQDSKFTAYPSTWLNGERWNDEPAKPARQSQNDDWWR